ncbi:MAG: DUF1801 domain-containing protein [Bacteroidota bacterium]
MEFIESNIVNDLLTSYPEVARDKLQELRQLIRASAEETDGVDKLVETTKWGEPSYVTKNGSTIRMDWKKNTPDKYYLFFICNTELVNTFKLIFGDELQYQGNRAVVLDLHDPMPSSALKRCITLALKYHKVKHLPMLGA